MIFGALMVVLGLLPSFAWLVFYLSEDPHTEPRRLILFTFFAGIAFTPFTILVEKAIGNAAQGIGIVEFSLASLVAFALIEEVIKFGAAYLAISRTPKLHDPIDPMIYTIIAALGFATFENIGTLANTAMSGPTPILTIFQTLSFRFVGATLLHTLASGIVGYYWSIGMAKRKTILFLLKGFALAVIVHTIFNYLVMNIGNISFAIIFLLLIGLIVLKDFDALKVREKMMNK